VFAARDTFITIGVAASARDTFITIDVASKLVNLPNSCDKKRACAILLMPAMSLAILNFSIMLDVSCSSRA